MHSISLAEDIEPMIARNEIFNPFSSTDFPNAISSVDNLAEALQALSEAERVMRTQAEHIRRLENMAMTDELTGLLNRRGFVMAFQRELALARRNSAAGGVLVMVDLDGFKTINDQFGHNAGDDYLRAVAQALVGNVRSSDLVARLGGDEFAVLFTHMPESMGQTRLAKLENSFNSRTMQTGDHTLPLRASFGLSHYDGMETPETILANADLKLYAHKAARRASA